MLQELRAGFDALLNDPPAHAAEDPPLSVDSEPAVAVAPQTDPAEKNGAPTAAGAPRLASWPN